jgi:asparagine synthase (glutamine-hydrolysing)
MSNEDGSVWIVFNGEVYNFPELRPQLEAKGHVFRSRSDTEVLVHGWEEWGLDLLPKLNGIFAFALVDQKQGVFLLARDRFGVKPLYYAAVPGGLAFASEIKALLVCQDVPRELDEAAVVAMANYRYTPEPITLFKAVRKLPPAHAMVIRNGGAPQFHEYFRLGYDEPRDPGDGTRLAAELREVMRAATHRQLIADVPVGLFLSGGLDSGALLAMAKDRLAPGQTKTFTIGFRQEDQKTEGQPDDLIYARRLANETGFDHQEIILEPKMVELLPEVVYHLDEPIADPAAISSYLICREARAQNIKVLLSGQGGDEVFCGYPWHLGAHLAARWRKVPRPLRRMAEGAVKLLPATGGGRLSGTFRRVRKFAADASQDFEPGLLGFLSYAGDQLPALAGERMRAAMAQGWPHVTHRAQLAKSRTLSPVNRLLHLDMGTFLPSLNLNYTDKTSMAHSVEVRVPFLDNEVVDWAGRIHTSWKMQGRLRKRILKKAFEGLLPHDLIYRRKAGFGAPIRSWVKKDLAAMIGDLLAPERIRARGWFHPGAVQEMLRRNASGREDWNYLIYFLLSFELWCRRFVDRPV